MWLFLHVCGQLSVTCVQLSVTSELVDNYTPLFGFITDTGGSGGEVCGVAAPQNILNQKIINVSIAITVVLASLYNNITVVNEYN